MLQGVLRILRLSPFFVVTVVAVVAVVAVAEVAPVIAVVAGVANVACGVVGIFPSVTLYHGPCVVRHVRPMQPYILKPQAPTSIETRFDTHGGPVTWALGCGR